MEPAFGSSIGIVAYLALFVSVGLVFLLVNLLVGKLVRPSDPYAEKNEVYECGEPTIGSSYVQFDLRFYVVALVFIVFDVEVAFLFPWATVFGKSVSLTDQRLEVVRMDDRGDLLLTDQARALHAELGVANVEPPPAVSAAASSALVRAGARRLAWFSAAVVGVFFLVLLVGFAYEWRTGAFDWVRAVTEEHKRDGPSRAPPEGVDRPLAEAESSTVSA